MAHWAMVIDLRKCIGCGICNEVCEKINNVPPGTTWRRLVQREIDGGQNGERIFLPMSCMHCVKPSCLEVCPTRATYRRADGIVDINYNLCVGCGSCVLACPYRARSIPIQDGPSETVVTEQDITVESPDRIGICTKCNFCLPRLEAGLSQDLRPGVDPEATPQCVRFCIADALHFGDLDDSDSAVSELIRMHTTVRLQEELGTEASVYYIVDDISFLTRR